jgi:hypothetical protein
MEDYIPSTVCGKEKAEARQLAWKASSDHFLRDGVSVGATSEDWKGPQLTVGPRE